MNSLYKKSKLFFSLTWIIAYVILFSFADNLSESLGMTKVITAPLGIAFVLILFIFTKKNNLSEEYGLCSFKGSWKGVLFFLPLVLIASLNLWNGIEVTSPLWDTVLSVISMLCVGFIEEVIFRGFLFKTMCKDNIKVAVLVSSITFGLGHIVNLLNGADFVPTFLQLCYATAIGFLFTMIFYKGKSLVPCIITHSVFNLLSIFRVQSTMLQSVITSIVLCVVSVAYALWILKKGQSTNTAKSRK